MKRDEEKQDKRPAGGETVFVGERQEFSDSPGGVPLDSPEALTWRPERQPRDRQTRGSTDTNGQEA